MKRVAWIGGLVVWLWATAAAPAARITVGSHALLANTPNQTVQIFVTGGEAVQGLDLYAQVADGGPAAGGSVVGPRITAVDILTGTIFAANNEGQDDPPAACRNWPPGRRRH